MFDTILPLILKQQKQQLNKGTITIKNATKDEKKRSYHSCLFCINNETPSSTKSSTKSSTIDVRSMNLTSGSVEAKETLKTLKYFLLWILYKGKIKYLEYFLVK
jgi:hypothetical protein